MRQKTGVPPDQALTKFEKGQSRIQAMISGLTGVSQQMVVIWRRLENNEIVSSDKSGLLESLRLLFCIPL